MHYVKGQKTIVVKEVEEALGLLKRSARSGRTKEAAKVVHNALTGWFKPPTIAPLSGLELDIQGLRETATKANRSGKTFRAALRGMGGDLGQINLSFDLENGETVRLVISTDQALSLAGWITGKVQYWITSSHSVKSPGTPKRSGSIPEGHKQ
jgi:hypothetical protein